MEKTAMLLKMKLPDFYGEARLYHLNPPLESYEGRGRKKTKYEYVIVSAVFLSPGGEETFIFPSDIHGNFWTGEELPGSYRGGLSHEEALRGAGYRIVEPTEK